MCVQYTSQSYIYINKQTTTWSETANLEQIHTQRDEVIQLVWMGETFIT